MAGKKGVRVEMVPLDDVERWPRNPKRHDVPALRESIRRFGFVAPLVRDDATGRIVVGHGRLEALLEMRDAGEDPPARAEGWRVPVLVGVSFRSEREAEAYLIADNRHVELGGWDDADLAAMLRDMGDLDESLLQSIGMTNEELTTLLDFEQAPSTGQTDLDAVPDEVTLCSKVGDVWRCGEHVVICGDATDADLVGRLVESGSVKMVFTDPPYGVSYADKNAFLNSIDNGNRIQREIAGDHFKPENVAKLWRAVFGVLLDACDDGACYYICSPQGKELAMMMMMTIRESGFLLKQMLVWVKNNHVFGRSDYHYKHEPILYGWKPGTHRFYGPPGEVSVWQIDRLHQSKLHPTMKPVELVERAIRNSSQRDELVMDPFLGSGTTMIAAENLGRRCVGFEIEPIYVDLAVRRWQDFIGKQATHKETGKPFDVVAEERQS